MKPEQVPITELVPHGPEASLLGALLSSTDACTIATVVVTPDSAFAEADGVPAYVGIEYMAQTIAARVGYASRLKGEPPPMGFLLGTRSYVCERPVFPFGSELTICAKPVFVDADFGSFECTIEADTAIVASATLNTYQPDPATFGRTDEQ